MKGRTDWRSNDTKREKKEKGTECIMASIKLDCGYREADEDHCH